MSDSDNDTEEYVLQALDLLAAENEKLEARMTRLETAVKGLLIAILECSDISHGPSTTDSSSDQTPDGPEPVLCSCGKTLHN